MGCSAALKSKLRILTTLGDMYDGRHNCKGRGREEIGTRRERERERGSILQCRTNESRSLSLARSLHLRPGGRGTAAGTTGPTGEAQRRHLIINAVSPLRRADAADGALSVRSRKGFRKVLHFWSSP